ncbi:MAG: ATP-binding protein [Vicinamibacterales bacterium]
MSKIARDITSRRQSESALREARRFRTLADNILAVRVDGRPRLSRARRWFDHGHHAGGDAGVGLARRAPSRPRGPRRDAHPAVVEDTGEEWEDTFPLRGRDGTYRWFLSRCRCPSATRRRHRPVVPAPTPTLTEQRQLKEDLRALSFELTETNRRKDEFLAALSHELRNPLGAVRTSLALLQAAEDQPAIRAQARAAMERQVAQMARLLDDLLDVSRITRDRLELRLDDVDLSDIVHAAVEASRPVCEAAGVSLTVAQPPGPVHVRGDAARLQQVLGNLLTNAAKYTGAGGRVWLDVEVRGADLVVRVRDTGIGIPPEMLSRIFDLFTQVDGHAPSSQGGLGIGLSLVRRLVELHGGTVSAASDGPGHGSTFLARMPIVVDVPATADAAPPGREAGGACRRVLVVDDDPDNAESLALLLTSMGHRVTVAHDGAEALDRAAATRPEAVLLDIGLPVLDGFETCRRMRAEPWGADVLIVALTGWGQAEDRRRTQQAGFDRHIVKPIDPSALQSLLESLPRTPAAS